MRKISIFADKGGEHRIYWCGAFAEGLKIHGVDFTLEAYNAKDIECDLSVCWGMKRPCVKKQKEDGKRFLILENGYWPDRRQWYEDKYDKDHKSEISIGYDGLNGYANFYNQNSPDDRWKRHWDLMKQWSPGNKYVVVMGQVSGDASVSHVNINEWYNETIDELLKLDVPVVFRQHPVGQLPKDLSIPRLRGDLGECLKGARVVVTFNSNVAVEAVLRGVPAVSMDRGSMAWDVSGHELRDVLDPPCVNRWQWACNLAYCSWSYREIESGLAWEHIRQGI